MKRVPNTQHMNANIQLRRDGDRATGRLMCYNPQEFTTEQGKIDVFVCGLWYVDEYVRTPDGWRIRRRSTTFFRKHGGVDSGRQHDPLSDPKE